MCTAEIDANWKQREKWQTITPANAAQQSAALTCLLVLTLFKGSYHQRKTCDWRLLSQYYSAWCMEVWTHCSLTRGISVRLCEQTTFHECRLLVNVALQLSHTGRCSMQHAKRCWCEITSLTCSTFTRGGAVEYLEWAYWNADDVDLCQWQFKKREESREKLLKGKDDEF